MKVRNNLDKIPVIAASNIIRNSYRGKVIFVEGKNDKKVIESIVKSPWVVRIYGEDIKNLKNIKNTMVDDFKNKYNQNQIAIVDKDYDYNESISNLYYTDYNDIECTALNLMRPIEIKRALNVNSTISDEEFLNKCFYPVLEYSNKFSLLWKYFRDNNLRIPYFTKNDNANIYLNRMLDVPRRQIDYDVLKAVYYNNYSVENIDFRNIMENKSTSNNFRGHDFFKVLSVVNNINGIDLLMLTDDVEGKFIANSCRYGWIEKSKLYNNIKRENPNCFN